MNISRIVLAGATSNVGKTSITSAIIYGLKKKGYTVQSFKVGPDYIDPSYLSAISGNSSRNLDAWLMGERELIRTFVTNSKSDISIIEGVMGYYDGFSGDSNYSSTHHVASILKSPTVLILDASKTARSIAATALGFTKFHKNSRIVGFILNKLGSKKHEMLCKQALYTFKIPILGSIPNDSELKLESRHLGLIPVIEQKHLKNTIKKNAKKISQFLDIEKIINICKKTSSFPKVKEHSIKKPKTTIAVALDNSFNFYYHDNLDALRREGAKLKFFSPISDSTIPKCDGIYIGGGFPEVLSNSLEKNTKMRKQVKKLAEESIPLYAECGGLMYLTKSIHNGKTHRMVGLIDAHTIMTKKMTLNYTKGKISYPCLLSNRSGGLYGHEFHFSEINRVAGDTKYAYKLDIGKGIFNKKDGIIFYNTLASYGHLYFDRSNFAKSFVENCLNYSKI